MDVECAEKKVTSLENVQAREKRSVLDVNKPVIVLQIVLNPVLHTETFFHFSSSNSHVATSLSNSHVATSLSNSHVATSLSKNPKDP